MSNTHPLGIPVPIFGITGDLYSGKSLLALSIAPGSFADGPNKGRPRSLYLDFEQSGASYSGAGAHRVDAPTELRTKFGAAAYKPIDVFNWFRSYVQSIPAGAYEVIIVDPITDVEDGLVDYVQLNPGEFGYTKDQIASGGGLLWGAVKNFWKLILVDLSARCQMFVFVSHMRMEFRGGRPTGVMKPKGKETLAEIASLYLQLQRDKSRDGEKPQAPSAIILKERLSITQVNKSGELEVIKMLPDRLPIATVKAIKHYIQHPVGKRALKPEELIQEPTMSEDDRLILQAEIEKSKADAEAKKLELWNLQRPMTLPASGVTITPPLAGQVGGINPPQPPAPPPLAPGVYQGTVTPGGVVTPAGTIPLPNTAPQQPSLPPAAIATPANPELQTVILQIRELGRGLYGTPDRFGPAFMEHHKAQGFNSLEQLDLIAAYAYKAHLQGLMARETVHQRHGYPSLVGDTPSPTQAPLPASQDPAPIEPFKTDSPMEEDQFNTLKELCSGEHPKMSHAEQDAWINHFGVQKLRDINQGQYQFLMTRRSERLKGQATQQTPETPSTSS